MVQKKGEWKAKFPNSVFGPGHCRKAEATC